MALRTARERRRALLDWRRRNPRGRPPVEVVAPGIAAAHPSLAGRAFVKRITEQQLAEVARLPATSTARLLPLLKQAERELGATLRHWIAVTPDGELRWSAQKYRATLGQIKLTRASIERSMKGALTDSTTAAQDLSLNHLFEEVARFSTVFEGTPILLSLERADLIASARSYIIPRIRTSSARYAGNVGEDIKQRLAVDVLKGAPLHETIDRLADDGGPRGLVALRGVAGEEGAIVELIPEGLFTRYRWWAERVVRTETASSYSAQFLDGLQAAKRQVPSLVKRWCAEGKACIDLCAPMDGTTSDLGGTFVLPNGDAVDGAPAHPNCCCRVGAWSSDWPDILASI